jgi:hypothetical protein
MIKISTLPEAEAMIVNLLIDNQALLKTLIELQKGSSEDEINFIYQRHKKDLFDRLGFDDKT